MNARSEKCSGKTTARKKRWARREHTSRLLTLGPCSAPWVIPDYDSTLTTIRSVYMRVCALPCGLVVYICPSSHPFHIHILQSDRAQLLCVVTGRPLSQRPRWILCPAPSVDYWVKATLQQGWYCNRKRGGACFLPWWSFDVNP